MRSKYKILTGILSLFLITFIVINVQKISSTIFSGTHYMKLPSQLYINENLVIKNVEGIEDTIRTGSYLLSVDEKCFLTKRDLENYLVGLKQSSEVKIKLFNIQNVDKIIDEDKQNKFSDLSQDYIVSVNKFFTKSITELPDAVFIGYVIENGATQRAGLKAGDVLMTINEFAMKMEKKESGEGFDRESFRYFRSLPKGEPIEYKIIRDNNIQIINVYLAQFGIPTNIMLTLICGLSLFFFGVFILIRGNNEKATIFTTLTMLIIGFEISSSFNNSPPDLNFFVWLNILSANFAVIFVLPVLFTGLLYFPFEYKKITERKILTYSVFLIPAAFSIVFLYLYITDLNKLDAKLFYGYIGLSLIHFFVINIIFREKQKQEFSGLGKFIRIIWLLFLFIALAPGLFSTYKIFPNQPKWFGYSYLVWILIPIIYTVLILKFKFFGISLILKRARQYTFLSLLIKSISIICFIAIVYFLAHSNISLFQIKFSANTVEFLTPDSNEPSVQAYNKIFFLILILFTGIVLLWISRKIHHYLDKKFHREKIDYKAVQEDLTKVLEKKFTIESLAKVLVEKISSLAKLKTTGVIFYHNTGKEGNGKIIYCYNASGKHYCDLEISQDIINELMNIDQKTEISTLKSDISQFLKSNSFAYLLPFKTAEKLLGTLFIGEKMSELAYRKEDFNFLSTLMINSAYAVENALLYEEISEQERIKKELEIAHQIQIASLPQRVPEVKGLDIAAKSLPAYEVGGDFYDFLNGAIGQSTIILGDVSGKGTSAALYMSKAQGIFQTLHEFIVSPMQLLTQANKLLYRHIDSKSYITVSCAYFDTDNRVIKFARAGHLPLYHYSPKQKTIRKLQPGGIGLGLSSKDKFDTSIEEIEIKYQKGDTFLFVSDGITDSLNKNGEQFGEDNMITAFMDNIDCDTKEILNNIVDTVNRFSQGMNQFDDMTLVIVKCND